MTIELLTELIGKPADHPSLQAFLAEHALAQRPKIPRSESGVYLSRHDLGLSLLFEEAGYFARQRGVPPQGDAPVLAAVFLYGEGNDEFSPYAGELPRGIAFSMSRPQLRERLGESALFDEDFNTEAWDLDGLRLFVDYDESRQSVLLIQLGPIPL